MCHSRYTFACKRKPHVLIRLANLSKSRFFTLSRYVDIVLYGWCEAKNFRNLGVWFLINAFLICVISAGLSPLRIELTWLRLLRNFRLKPRFDKTSAMFRASLLGGCSQIRVIPAFSAKGLYFAMTAGISTNSVPASSKVSLTSLTPSPIVRYFGCTTARPIELSSLLSSLIEYFANPEALHPKHETKEKALCYAENYLD